MAAAINALACLCMATVLRCDGMQCGVVDHSMCIFV